MGGASGGRRTAKSGSEVKASGVSGLGVGPEPGGWVAQLPSRGLRLMVSRLVPGEVMGVSGAEEAGAGMFLVTSIGGVTRTGSGKASMALRSMS